MVCLCCMPLLPAEDCERMSLIKDQLPRTFQANLARLFDRVILPGLDALPLHPRIEYGEATTFDQFLVRAAAQVDNYMANEAAKAYTLTVAAVFERQLSIWARANQLTGPASMPKLGTFPDLLAVCTAHAGIDVVEDGLGPNLTQMFVVANVVRHGEGPSCEKLRVLAPGLFDDEASDYQDLLPGPSVPSEHLRIRRNDLVRYMRATTRFWGLSDPLPMAVTDSPYRVD